MAGANVASEQAWVLTTGSTYIIQAGLSWGHLASGPSKAAMGVAQQTALLQADSTEGQCAEDTRTKWLVTRGKLTGQRREFKATWNKRQSQT